MHVLVVIDMQNDFISGALGTPEAAAIVPRVVKKISIFDGLVLATRDTHGTDYLKTQEGKNLPVEHCVRGTQGWRLHPDIAALIEETPIDKPGFGSVELCAYLQRLQESQPIESVTLVGLCTDICVISNAMLLKAYLPEIPVFVDAACCAGVTPESHRTALNAMRMCQITIVE